MRVLILGATGSIGKQCCEVCLQRRDKIVGISFFNKYVLANKIKAQYKFSSKYHNHSNVKSYEELIKQSQPDIVIIAISDLQVATRMLKIVVDLGIDIILANKEALILNANKYEYWTPGWGNNGVKIIPLDSEHSSLLQIMSQNYKSHGGFEKIAWYAISASSGRFINKTAQELQKVKYEQVINHPVWNMGKEITINSATMFNKFTEMFEAFFIMSGKIPRVFVDKKAKQHAIICYKNGDCFVHEHKPTMTIHINDCLNFFAKKNPSVHKLNCKNIQWITNASFINLFNDYFKNVYESSFYRNISLLFAKNTMLVNKFINKSLSFYSLIKQIYN